MATTSSPITDPPFKDFLGGDGTFLREAIDSYIQQVAEEDGLILLGNSSTSASVDADALQRLESEIERISEAFEELSLKVDLGTESKNQNSKALHLFITILG